MLFVPTVAKECTTRKPLTNADIATVCSQGAPLVLMMAHLVRNVRMDSSFIEMDKPTNVHLAPDSEKLAKNVLSGACAMIVEKDIGSCQECVLRHSSEMKQQKPRLF